MGRFEESIVEQKRALEMDPLSFVINAMMGLIFTFASRHNGAVD